MSRLVDHQAAHGLGTDRVVRFEQPDQRLAGDRFLTVEGKRIYFIGPACPTCRFWFDRLDDADHAASVVLVRDRFARGLDSVSDPAVETFSTILPGPSDYLIMLVDVVPSQIRPYGPRDWYVREHHDWRGQEEPPRANPLRIPYYRGSYRRLDTTTELLEFLFPLVDPEHLDLGTVNAYRERMMGGEHPTVVAVSVLDVRMAGGEPPTEWLLSHYLLDGHHKMYAAATAGLPVRLLAFLSKTEGFGGPKEIEQLLTLLSEPGADEMWPTAEERLRLAIEAWGVEDTPTSPPAGGLLERVLGVFRGRRA